MKQVVYLSQDESKGGALDGEVGEARPSACKTNPGKLAGRKALAQQRFARRN